MLLASCVLGRAYGGTCRLFLGLDGSCLHGRPDNFTYGKMKNINMKMMSTRWTGVGKRKAEGKMERWKEDGGEEESVCEKQREKSSTGQLARQVGLVGTVPI